MFLINCNAAFGSCKHRRHNEHGGPNLIVPTVAICAAGILIGYVPTPKIGSVVALIPATAVSQDADTLNEDPGMMRARREYFDYATLLWPFVYRHGTDWRHVLGANVDATFEARMELHLQGNYAGPCSPREKAAEAS
jgi:hypothetical protein